MVNFPFKKDTGAVFELRQISRLKRDSAEESYAGRESEGSYRSSKTTSSAGHHPDHIHTHKHTHIFSPSLECWTGIMIP